jgi:hypothetical protein
MNVCDSELITDHSQAVRDLVDGRLLTSLPETSWASFGYLRITEAAKALYNFFF